MATIGFLYLHLVQTVELIELADFYLLLLVRFVVVADDDLLIDGDRAIVNLADTDASHILIVVDGADQHLRACLGIALRRGDIVEDRLKQRGHVDACAVLV